MKLSERHQKIFDETFPDGYDASKIVKLDGRVADENDIFHIMYIKIIQDGERTRDVPCMVKYSVRDWLKTKAIFDVHAIKAITGYSEFAVIHDPTAKVGEAKAKPAKAEVKPGAKAKGRPPQK